MSEMHSLERGKTLSSKYGNELGGHTGKMVAPPGKISAFIVGLPGEGKSHLLQSNPAAYIFNLDSSSTVCPDPQALMFPGVDPETGRLVGDGGKDVVLTWDLVQEKVAVLKRLAVEGKPRPDTVVFDSLTAGVRLLKSWIPANARKLGIASEPKSEWKDLHGPAAWDLLYDTLVNIFKDLRNHGYGVFVIGHVVNAKIPLGENQYAYKFELTITDGFWKRLYDMFELSAVVYVEDGEEEKTTEVKTSVRGVEKTEVRKVKVRARKHYLAVQKLDLAGIVKTRVKLPDRIELPETGAWAAFEKVYVDCSK